MRASGRLCGARSAALGLLLCSGCASTKLDEVWKASDAGAPVRKVLVLAVVPGETQRRGFENALVQRLQERRLQAVPSYSLAPEGQKMDAASMEALARREGFDSVLIARYTGTRTGREYVPGHPVGDPWALGVYGYYGALWPYVYERGHVEETETVSMETMLYRSAGKGELLWSTVSETFDPTSSAQEAKDVSGAVVERMAKDRVI